MMAVPKRLSHRIVGLVVGLKFDAKTRTPSKVEVPTKVHISCCCFKTAKRSCIKRETLSR